MEDARAKFFTARANRKIKNAHTIRKIFRSIGEKCYSFASKTRSISIKVRSNDHITRSVGNIVCPDTYSLQNRKIGIHLVPQNVPTVSSLGETFLLYLSFILKVLVNDPFR
jgi:hypothetical protein